MANTHHASTRYGRWCLAFMACGCCTSTSAATWLDSLYLAFDTPVQTNASVLPTQQVLKTQYATAPQAVSVGLSAPVPILTMTMQGANVLYVPAIPFTLNGGAATPHDIIEYAGGTSTVYLTGNTLGLPSTVKIDAIALLGADVLFSISARSSVSGTMVGPGDVLRWNGAAVSVLYSAATLGLPANAKVTGLEHLPNNHLLMTFDSPGKVGGVPYRAGEILEYAPTTASWSLVRNQAQLDVVCAPCRLRGIAAVANLDVVFKNGYDQYEH